MESYQHLLAKKVFAKWLENGPPPGFPVPFNSYVFEEYPLTATIGISPVWHEHEEPDQDWSKKPPTRQQCLDMGYTPKVILDVACLHKGALLAGFEIVHKNGISPAKLRRFEECQKVQGPSFYVYTVPASWIMSQVGVPKTWSALTQVF